MVLQIRVSEYLLLMNDIHCPCEAVRDNEPDRFRGFSNGL
jgi:hypothetical protein